MLGIKIHNSDTYLKVPYENIRFTIYLFKVKNNIVRPFKPMTTMQKKSKGTTNDPDHEKSIPISVVTLFGGTL